MKKDESGKPDGSQGLSEETLLQDLSALSPAAESEAETEIRELPVIHVPPVTRQFPGNVTGLVQEGNRLLITDGAAAVEVKILSDEIIRIRLAPNGEFLPEFSYAVSDHAFEEPMLEVAELEDCIQVTTRTIICQILKADFRISILDLNNMVVNEDIVAMHWEENTPSGGYFVHCSKILQDTEHFSGLGDKPMRLDLLGKQVQNWNTDFYNYERDTDPIYKSIPFYTGTHHQMSYGIFFDNTYRSTFDFANEETDRVSFRSEGGEMNYYFIFGPRMIDVVSRYSQLTGAHTMPPKWALGFHQSRWSYFPEKKVKKLAKLFREKKIPCDAIHFDIDYMDGFRCFTWNTKYFPHPKKLITDLAHHGFKAVAIIDPGIKIDEKYPVYKEGKERDFFCRRGDDYYMEGQVWPGRCRFPDFTNPEVREWWGGLFAGLIEDGVSGIWNDMNEPAVFGTGTFPNDVRHHYDGFPCSHRKAHNIYGMLMARATVEGLQKNMNGRRPFTITRSGYSGVQRYASTWTGDNAATWEHLKLAVLMLQRLSISGISFCGSDIGGFTGEPDAELYTRWIQFGAFSPFMRVHSAGDTREREPWTFGSETEAIVRKFIELRYRLMPYIYTSFRGHVQNHVPILRPLFMIDEDQPDLFSTDDVFAYGEKILVAPITDAGVSSRDVYLPRGVWYHYWNNEVLEGGRTIAADAPLDSMPVFVKGGSVIPESPVMQYVEEFQPEEMILNVYYAPSSETSTLYEDDGITFAFEQGGYSERKFMVAGSEKEFSIQQTIEGSFDPRYSRYKLRLIGVPFVISHIRVDDQLAAIDESNESGIVSFLADKNFKKIQVT